MSIKLNDFEIGNDKLTILAGPCAVESLDIMRETAEGLKKVCEILDINYGNVWTNIDRNIVNKLNLKKGNKYNVVILNGKKTITINNVVYSNTFCDVKQGKPVLYFNSLDYLAIALNSGNFAKQYKVGYGAKWKIKIKESN